MHKGSTPNTSVSLIMALLASALVLAGCDSDDNDVTNDTSETSMPAPGEGPGDEVTLEGLDGNWITNCIASATDTTYSIAALSVSDNLATLTESFYTDNACSSAAVPATAISDRSLSFDGNTANTSLGDASTAVWTVESRTVDGDNSSDGVNTTVYDLMLIANDTLYFGDRSGTNDGSSEALRPTTLDEVATFTMDE